jgi:hypothetical protein
MKSFNLRTPNVFPAVRVHCDRPLEHSGAAAHVATSSVN